MNHHCWLKQTDSQGFVVGKWCREDAPGKGYCILCQKSFLVTNSGFKQVLAHSKSTKHQELAKARFDTTQKHFKVETMPGAVEMSLLLYLQLKKPLVRQQVLKMNMQALHPRKGNHHQWYLIKVFKKTWLNLNYFGQWKLLTVVILIPHVTIPRPCLRECFRTVSFQIFSLGKSKVSYLISDGLGPYYRKVLCENVSKAPGFVIQYDETSNSQVRKQMDVLVRYWSEAKGEVVVRS